MSTFISVGNSEFKFDRLINSVINNFYDLPKPILYQYGYSKKIDTNVKYFKQIDFLTLDEYYLTLKNSNFFISHLGAGSLINSIKFNIKSIFLSRRFKNNEHIDDHQFELFEYLKKIKKFQNVFFCEKEFSSSIKKIITSDIKKYKINTNEIVNIVDKLLED